MKMLTYVALATLALGLISVAGCNTSTLIQGRITGTVYESGSPTTVVAGARVTTTRDSVTTGSTETSTDGTYEIRDLVDGTHVLTIERTGYVTQTDQTVSITIGGTARKDIYLAAIKGSISGTVLNLTSVAGLPGVTVTATLNGTAVGTALTDDNGAYTITDLEDGTYTLTAARTGYTTQVSPDPVTIVNWSNAQGANFGLVQ